MTPGTGLIPENPRCAKLKNCRDAGHNGRRPVGHGRSRREHAYMDRLVERIGPFRIVTASTALARRIPGQPRRPDSDRARGRWPCSWRRSPRMPRPPRSRAMPSPCMASRRCRRPSPAMPYVNPDAPKGGRLVQGVLGTFDSLNPMIVRGLPLPSIRGYVIEGLMARGYDEPFTLYGLLARNGRDRRRALLRHLQSQSAGALLRRQAGDAGRRGVLLAIAARQGPAESTAPIIPR